MCLHSLNSHETEEKPLYKSKQADPPSASHMASDCHADETRQHKPNVHSILSFRTHFTALHSPEAGWQMSAAFTRSCSAPSACLSFARLRHPGSDITRDVTQDLRGDPCSQANVGSLFQRGTIGLLLRPMAEETCCFLEMVNAYQRTLTHDTRPKLPMPGTNDGLWPLFFGWKMHLASNIWRKDSTLGTRIMTAQRTTVQPTSESGELANRKEALRREQASPRGPDDQDGNMKSQGRTYQTTSER